MREIHHKGVIATQTEEGKAWVIKLPARHMSFIGTDEELNKLIDVIGDIFMVNRKDRELPGWGSYAIDACQCIVDASLYWTGVDEEKNPLLKRARTMAGKAVELWKKES